MSEATKITTDELISHPEETSTELSQSDLDSVSGGSWSWGETPILYVPTDQRPQITPNQTLQGGHS